MENGHKSQNPSAERVNVSAFGELQYEKKYMALLKKCTALQQNNEWLVNRLHHVKKLLRKIRQERRFLMRRLDSHQDRYADVPLILPTDPDLESVQDLPGISTDLLPFCSSSTSVDKRPSSKSSRTSLFGKTSAPAVGSSTSSSVRKITSKGSGKKKARACKDKDRGRSKRCVPIKQHSTPSALFTSRQDEKNVQPIKKEDLSNEVEKNWRSSITNSENKKSYYDDIYEHSYDVMQPSSLDQGITSVCRR